MSGLVCLGDAIVDLNRIACVIEMTFGGNMYMSTGDKVEKVGISVDAFKMLKKIVIQRSDTQNTVEQLTKENQHLRSIIAAMPGFGEDYKTAKIEFEHVTQK